MNQREPVASIDEGVARLRRNGVTRVHVLAWRDLDDPDAGGSEEHADQFMRRWAAGGLEVLHRTSFAVGEPTIDVRNGYRVVRRGGRYTVFPRVAASELVRRMGAAPQALVEICNGVPWFSPLWFRGPRVNLLHHVHGPMWDQQFPRPIAAIGKAMETRLAPLLYRSTLTVTGSEQMRDELHHIGFRRDRTRVVPYGGDPFFSPDESRRSPTPLIVAAGRLAAVKRFDELIAAVAEARRSHPDLRLVILGEGPDRALIQAQIERLGAARWVSLAGFVTREALRDWFRQAWLVASASLAEGWGLVLTEAAACATPAVATDITGHRASVIDGATGVLAPLTGLGPAIADLLRDHGRRGAMGVAGRRRMATLTWDECAVGMLDALVSESERRAGCVGSRHVGN